MEMYINHQSKTWGSTCVRRLQLMINLKESEMKLHWRRCYLILPCAVHIHTLIRLGVGGVMCWVKSKNWPSWKFTGKVELKKKKNKTPKKAKQKREKQKPKNPKPLPTRKGYINCLTWITVLLYRCSWGPRAGEGAPVQNSQHSGTPLSAVHQASIHLQYLLTYSLRNLSSFFFFFLLECLWWLLVLRELYSKLSKF